MMIDWAAVRREALVATLFFLPERQNIRLDRWLRGRQENAKLRKCDCVVVSFPNSGRTWLHILLAKYYQLAHSLDAATSLDIAALRQVNDSVPDIFFTHDNYLRDFTGAGASKSAYFGKPIVLLVRDPADVSVSQFHQWRHRMRRRKIKINNYPGSRDLNLYRFTIGPNGSIERVSKFLNDWAAEMNQAPRIILVRYEDLVADTAKELAAILAFLGESPDANSVEGAVAYANLGNMRKLEDHGNQLFRPGKVRMSRPAGDDGYKARRAKIGGYREDFSKAEANLIDAEINRLLVPTFGYHRAAESALKAGSLRSA
jgi:hypothetical protein